MTANAQAVQEDTTCSRLSLVGFAERKMAAEGSDKGVKNHKVTVFTNLVFKFI